MDLTTYLNAGQTEISNLIISQYRQLGMDEKDLVLYLQILSEQQQGKMMPDLNQIARQMNCTVNVIYQQINHLIQLGVIGLKTVETEDGKKDDYYDTTVIFDKVNNQSQTMAEKLSQQLVEQKKLFQLIEQELGRPLSSMEIDHVSQWIRVDQYELPMIELAFREAIIHGARGPLQYADKILLSWTKSGITTTKEAQREIDTRRQTMVDKQLQKRQEQKRKSIPIVNSWK